MSKKILPALLILVLVFSAVLTLNPISTDAATNSPVKLKIYLGPTSVLADNNTYACVNVQFQDQAGNPARASSDTPIALSSSQTSVGSVEPTVTIFEGDTYAQAYFTSTFLPGSTTIYASANGYTTVQASMTTVGPIPYAVAVYGFPSTLPADGLTYEAIMVQLQDVKGVPALAPKGGVFVALSCSETTVGMVSPNVTIPEGQTCATANFTTTLESGEAMITSIAQGYSSEQLEITTAPISGSPNRIMIFAGPRQVPADHGSYTQIAVEMLQETLQGINAVKVSENVTVCIGSSDPTVGAVAPEIVIPAGQSYAVATLNTTYKPGTTTITAAATDMERSQCDITTTGFTPSKLMVFLAPSALPADDGEYQNLQVQLQDSSGRPAKVPTGNIIVDLFSSVPSVAAVGSTLTIPFGQTQATGTIYVTNTPGATAISAQAASFNNGVAALNTYLVDLLPLEVTATASPTTVENGLQTEVTVHVTADNNPVSGAIVRFSCDNGGSFTTAIDQGSGNYKSTYTAPSFTQTTTCTINATAEKAGYLTTSATTQVSVKPPPSAEPSPSPSVSPAAQTSESSTSDSTQTTNQTSTSATTQTTAATSTFQLQIKDANGKPLTSTEVSSTSQPAGVRHLYGITNDTGYVTFRNVVEGKYTFSVMKEGYEEMAKTVTYSGQPLSVEVAVGGSDQGSDQTLTIIVSVVLVIVAVVLGLLLVRRRRRSRSGVTELPPLSSFNPTF